MTFSPQLPFPVAMWEEHPRQFPAAGVLTPLAAYKRTDGYWVFAEPGTQPAGATRGAMVRTSGYSAPTTSTTSGLTITRGPSGFAFFY
jgi:hypothetical protein